MVSCDVGAHSRLGGFLLALALVLRVICLGSTIRALTSDDYFFVKSVYTPPVASFANTTIITEYFNRDLDVRGTICRENSMNHFHCMEISSNVIPINFRLRFQDNASFQIALIPSASLLVISVFSLLSGIVSIKRVQPTARKVAMGFTFLFSFLHLIPTIIAVAIFPLNAYGVVRDAIRAAVIPHTSVSLHPDKSFALLILNLICAILSMVCVGLASVAFGDMCTCGTSNRLGEIFSFLNPLPPFEARERQEMARAFAEDNGQRAFSTALSGCDRPHGVQGASSIGRDHPGFSGPGSISRVGQPVPYLAPSHPVGQIYEPVPLPLVSASQYSTISFPPGMAMGAEVQYNDYLSSLQGRSSGIPPPTSPFAPIRSYPPGDDVVMPAKAL